MRLWDIVRLTGRRGALNHHPANGCRLSDRNPMNAVYDIPVIETRRLSLRQWRMDVADALYKYASDPKVSKLALWPSHRSVDMSRWVIETVFLPNPRSFAIVLKSTGEAIGCIGLVPAGDEHYAVGFNEREVGYWVGYPYWRKGLTSEALDALVGYMRESGEVSSLLITADSTNTGSHRVAEKCGFELIDEYSYCNIPSKAFRLKLV